MFEQIPKTLRLREVRYNLVERGQRSQWMTVVTTLIDEAISQEEVAELYGFRWNAELDQFVLLF